MGCRGHFGPQAEISGWNTALDLFFHILSLFLPTNCQTIVSIFVIPLTIILTFLFSLAFREYKLTFLCSLSIFIILVIDMKYTIVSQAFKLLGKQALSI